MARGRPKGSKNRKTVAKQMANLQSVNTVIGKKLNDPFKKMTDVQVVELIRERFDVMHQMSIGATKGAVRGTIISGAPGVGKSHTVEWVLEQAAHKNPAFKSYVAKGALTAVNLYKLLWNYRHEGNVIVLDDADSIFFDNDGLSLLKAALDSGARRRICWLSESNALKADGIDTEMDFNGTLIFITNTDFQRIVDEGKSKLAPHFEAMMNRSIYVDLRLHGRRAVALWVKHIVSKNNILIDKFSLTARQQNECLDYILKNQDKLRTLSIREALKLAQFMRVDPINWERTANIVLLRNDLS